MVFDLSALDAHLPNGSLGNKPGAAAFAPLASFEEDPDNPRFEDDPAAFELLVADVRERGILQPVIVRRLGNGKLQIRFGARRYRAARELGLASIPYVVTEDARQFDDYSQVAENQHRANMQPLELAAFAAKRVAAGDKKNLIAERLGLHPSALTHLLCLTGDVPAFMLELYHGNKCRSTRYLYQLRGFWGDAPQLVEQACAAAGEIDIRFIESLANEVKEHPVGDWSSSPGAAMVVDLALADPSGGAAPSKLRKTGRRGAPPSRSLSVSLGDTSPSERRRGWPRLFGIHLGREVVIEIFTPPSSDGMVHVRFLDTGAVAEAAAREVVLVRVSEHGG